MSKASRKTIQKGAALWMVLWLSLLSPTVAFAQDAQGNPTGPQEPTGPQGPTGPQEPTGPKEPTGPSCVGTSCEVSAEDYAAWEAKVSGSSVEAENTNTGENSTNANTVDSNTSKTTTATNQATDTTNAAATGSTGGNAQSSNTSAEGVTTGNAGIGVTQVKKDNTTTIGGTSGVQVTGHNGDHVGDLNLGFGTGTANLSGASAPNGIRAVNDTTGGNSTNDVTIATTTEEINEIQNDGRIDNLLNLLATTGQNTANMNTSDGSITTGDADIAATLINLLNTNVINGNLLLSVADIFGDLTGNIVLPDLATLASMFGPQLAIDAVNEQTGNDSTNTIDVDVRERETTTVDNDAEIATTVNAKAITGQNETLSNTGGGFIETGDANVSASNLSLANTTIEGGNWGLVVVNALNRWLGFLVGDNGEVRALSQAETLQEIEARNSNTGNDSDNAIDIDVERNRTTTVDNNAVINNEINADAITGQNEASMNTGAGMIKTGDASVKATAVNIANTTVKDASLFIAVVNIFGDWLGDLMYGGNSLLAAAGSGASHVNIDGENSNTGADSDNTINVNVDRQKETTVTNEADIGTILNAEVDTGTNKTNSNTKGGDITTGHGTLALHARTLANLTGIAIDPALGLTVNGLNDTTGPDSTNRIRATLNDERLVEVTNNANVSTIFGALANTGNNEANMNTIGGNIATGNTIANVGIHNLINQVLLALAGNGGGFGLAADGHIMVDANLVNQFTGPFSENSNEVVPTFNFLADIFNNGVVNNLVDLLLNTGGNTANENTNGGNIFTGAGCVKGDISTSINKVALSGLGGWSLALDSDADVDTDANIDVTTGSNTTNDNTNPGDATGGAGKCPEKLAEVPEEPEQPEEPGNGGGNGGDNGGGDQPGGQGGDDGEGGQEEVAGKAPRVAAAVSRVPRIAGDQILKRFPVAGGEDWAAWMEGKRRFPWLGLGLVSLIIVGVASHLDKQAHLRRELLRPPALS